MPTAIKHRVFISYSREDQEHVLRFDRILRDNGLDPIWDRDLPEGAAFTEKIQALIAHAHVFVPLITDFSKDRPWVHQEIGFASALNVPVLPVSINVSATRMIATPKGMIGGLQAVRLNAPMTDEDIATRLSKKVFDDAVMDGEGPGRNPALYRVAPDNMSRANLITEYARGVRRLGRSGTVRQKGALSSFHIPDNISAHRDWADRYGGQRRPDYYCNALRDERLALQWHVKEAGCKLILNLALRFTEYGPQALPSRLCVLLDFIKAPSAPNLAVAVLPTEAPEGPQLQDQSTTIVGDWFFAESVKGTLGLGYEQTVFTRHAHSVRRRGEAFDEEFDLILKYQPGGEAGSRDYAIRRIEAIIASANQRAKAVTESNWSLRFAYAPDSPMAQGWALVEGEPKEVTFSRVQDDKGAAALSVRTDRRYALDYEFGDLGFAASQARIVFRPWENARVYLRLALAAPDGSKRALGWIALSSGTKESAFVGDPNAGWWEWLWSVEPTVLQSNWLQIDVNLTEVIGSTVEKHGWRLESISGIRVRGSIDLARVDLF